MQWSLSHHLPRCRLSLLFRNDRHRSLYCQFVNHHRMAASDTISIDDDGMPSEVFKFAMEV
jgi:hypothetical protein